MTKRKTFYTLNQQIRQLQQQMVAELVLQQQQRLRVRELLVKRLTSWPVLLGAVATGLLLSQTKRQDNTAAPAPLPVARTVEPTSVLSREPSLEPSPEPASFWSKLLSLPLLTQSIWWLAEQVWYSRLFRDAVRQKLLKSEQRHPPY